MHELHPHDEAHTYRYCPRCGHALEKRSLKPNEPDRLVCARCGFVFYIDPKIAVGTIIRSAPERLVLVRRAIEPGYGKWVFPGGYVDRGEALTIAALARARDLGCAGVTLNATAEGELLYRSVGFHSLGLGMTWWLFPS